jgi:hypothetical protein
MATSSRKQEPFGMPFGMQTHSSLLLIGKQTIIKSFSFA